MQEYLVTVVHIESDEISIDAAKALYEAGYRKGEL